jgi:predicted metal-dependent HD superfamily phosphohydrolase
MNWTRITDTELGQKAWDILDVSDCEYHNGWHVLKMYNYLHETNEPYDESLDWAVLFHDIVYDAKPEKELRSAKMFVQMVEQFAGCKLRAAEQGRVYSLIMRTVDHTVIPEVKGSSAIIRADLHGLTNPVEAFINYYSILNESVCLYNIDEKTFAENNIRFMGGNPLGGDDRGLYGRVEKNMETDPDHREFYKEVKRGIVSTINLSRILKGDL